MPTEPLHRRPDAKIETDGQRDKKFFDLVAVGDSTFIEDTYTLGWRDGEAKTFKRRFVLTLVDNIAQ